jgi:hypothetical protein
VGKEFRSSGVQELQNGTTDSHVSMLGLYSFRFMNFVDPLQKLLNFSETAMSAEREFLLKSSRVCRGTLLNSCNS